MQILAYDASTIFPSDIHSDDPSVDLIISPSALPMSIPSNDPSVNPSVAPSDHPTTSNTSFMHYPTFSTSPSPTNATMSYLPSILNFIHVHIVIASSTLGLRPPPEPPPMFSILALNYGEFLQPSSNALSNPVLNYGEYYLPSHAFHAPGFVLLVKFVCILFSHLSSLLSIKDFKMMGSDRNVLTEFTFNYFSYSSLIFVVS